jgi:hypothetical protein
VEVQVPVPLSRPVRVETTIMERYGDLKDMVIDNNDQHYYQRLGANLSAEYLEGMCNKKK